MNYIKNYILELEELSKNYQDQDSLFKRELNNSILNKLRELYRRHPKEFTDQNIVEINKLKIIIQTNGSRYIKNCYFKIENKLDKMNVYVNTPVGEYPFLNKSLLNNNLENDEIEIKLNALQEIEFIFDKIKGVYLYPSPNQQTFWFKGNFNYKFYNKYYNCKYNFTQLNDSTSGIIINIGDLNKTQCYRTYSIHDLYITYHAYEDRIITIMTNDDIIYYFCTLNEYYQGIDLFDGDEYHVRNSEKYHKNKDVLNEQFKNEIKDKLLNIVKNKNKYSLVTELKEYISEYLYNNYIKPLELELDMPPSELKVDYMYDYICGYIDEIVDSTSKDDLNHNLKRIYDIIDDSDNFISNVEKELEEFNSFY